LEHRLEPCGDIGGVRCINDSKATNVDATLTALDAFDTEAPIILLGGRDKGGELAELVKKCEEKASAVVCFGEAADRFADAFEGSSIPVMKVATMEEAIDAALSVSEPGEVILLSPACASFDEFTCFEDRGEKFKEMVKARSDAAKTEADLYVVDPSNDPRDPEVSAY
ncbi:MAG: UDP-N-acetylmuramoyl-L-alanine--D-glutamate ligase, partial [Eggerthellaceae bacterium]|nr:UDP-N-acetylmuramoyl-L-alanine--D-glutamate ligase [Eggerthellaceae bacterium]